MMLMANSLEIFVCSSWKIKAFSNLHSRKKNVHRISCLNTTTCRVRVKFQDSQHSIRFLAESNVSFISQWAKKMYKDFEEMFHTSGAEKVTVLSFSSSQVRQRQDQQQKLNSNAETHTDLKLKKFISFTSLCLYDNHVDYCLGSLGLWDWKKIVKIWAGSIIRRSIFFVVLYLVYFLISLSLTLSSVSSCMFI
jgi:hypothetical protein